MQKEQDMLLKELAMRRWGQERRWLVRSIVLGTGLVVAAPILVACGPNPEPTQPPKLLEKSFIDEPSQKIIASIKTDLNLPRYQDIVEFRGASGIRRISEEVADFLAAANSGEMIAAITRHSADRWQTQPTDDDYHFWADVDRYTDKFRAQIVWGSRTDPPQNTEITDRVGLLHELVHGIYYLALYRAARNEAKKNGTGARYHFHRLVDIIREEEVSKLIRSGRITTEKPISLSTILAGYKNDADLLALGFDNTYLARFPVGERKKERAINPDYHGMDEARAFEFLLAQNGYSVQKTALTPSWRWCIERTLALTHLHNEVPQSQIPKFVLPTIGDSEVDPEFFQFVTNPDNKIIYQPITGPWTGRKDLSWDITEKNPEIRGLILGK